MHIYMYIADVIILYIHRKTNWLIRQNRLNLSLIESQIELNRTIFCQIFLIKSHLNHIQNLHWEFRLSLASIFIISHYIGFIRVSCLKFMIRIKLNVISVQHFFLPFYHDFGFLFSMHISRISYIINYIHHHRNYYDSILKLVTCQICLFKSFLIKINYYLQNGCSQIIKVYMKY